MNKLLLTALCAGTAATVALAVPRAATSSARQADGSTASVTVKWTLVENQALNQKDAYREFALIDSKGAFTAIGVGHATYKNRTEDDRYVLQMAPGTYDFVMAFDMSVNNSKNKVKYVIAENVVITGDTLLTFDAATATRHIGFRATTPEGERIRVPQMNGGKMVFDSINAKMLVECRFLYRKNTSYMKGDVKQHPYDNVKAALRPGEFSDVLVNPGVSSNFVFGFAAQYNKSEPRYGSSDFSEGTSDVMMTLATTADTRDTILRPDRAKFIEFTPAKATKTLYQGTPDKYPAYTRHAVAFRNSGAVMSIILSMNKSTAGSFIVCNNNPSLLTDVFSVAWPESSTKLPNCATPAGILTPWAIAEADGSCRYVMPNNAPDGYNMPYRDRRFPNMYLDFTEGNPFYAYSSHEVTPDFGSSAPVLSFMAYDNEITRTNATYAMSQNVSPHFLGNFGEDRNIDALAATWKIYAADTLLFTGPFNAAFKNALSNHYKKAHGSHKMRITMDNGNYKLDDIQGSHHVEITFTENAADVTPPSITNLRLRDRNGRITNRFSCDKATLTFSFADLAIDTVTKAGLVRQHCEAKVECAPHGTTDFREIPTQEIANLYDEFYGWTRRGEFTAATLGAPVRGWYDLRLTLTDAAGNAQTQTISPAFYCKWGTDGVEGTEADGIQISVDGQQITVIGTESATLYSTDGKYIGTAAGNDRLTLTAPIAGVYLLRVGTNTRKVYVK